MPKFPGRARGLGKFSSALGAVSKDPAATTKRNRIIFGVASFVTLAGSYFGIIKPENVKLKETRVQAEQAEAQVAQLTAQLAHLRDLERRAFELTEQAVRLNEALPMEAYLDRFILQVHEASNQANLEWVSVTPTPPAASGAAPGLMESSIAVTGQGNYVAVQDFLVRLENLKRALKIGSINLTGMGEDPAAGLNMTLNLKMFLAPTAPPFPMEPAPGAPAPAPGPAAPTTANAAGPPPGIGG